MLTGFSWLKARLAADCGEQSNKSLGSLEDRGFLDQFSNYLLFNNNTARRCSHIPTSSYKTPVVCWMNRCVYATNHTHLFYASILYNTYLLTYSMEQGPS